MSGSSCRPIPRLWPKCGLRVSIDAAGKTEVYDLTVDTLHNFVAGDIVVHNSIEQDADIVMFIYINFAIRYRDINGYIAMLLDMPSIAALKVLLGAYIGRVAGDSPK